MRILMLLVITALTAAACTNSGCSENDAQNKMLALGRVQARIAAEGTPIALEVMAGIGMHTGKVSELIAQKDYDAACSLADEIAKKYSLDLDREAEGMLTIEDLKKDGGRRGGECSLADAARKQMEIHGKLQARVDAGKASSDVFRQFNDDTAGFANLLTTDPSAACRLLEDVKKKYALE